MLTTTAQRMSCGMRHWIVASFVLLGLLQLPSTPAFAQQVIQTYSAGAPNDPYNAPTDLAFDKAGNLFVSDKGNHRVQRIDSQTKAVVTIAGTGAAGYSGDAGRATQAQLSCPAGLAFDDSGNLYIADPCSNVVRKVSPGADSVVSGASDEIITTFAGNGTRDACNWTDGVLATQTSVDSPFEIVIDKGGNAFILSSDCQDLLRRVDAGTGLISTTSFSISFTGNSMAFDNLGNLVISRFGEIDICSSANGQLLTGNESCSSTAYRFGISPLPRAFDKAGNLYFSEDTCDCSNGDLQIFKMTPDSTGVISVNSTVLLFAGNGTPGYSGDGGPPLQASFRGPRGMAADDAGNLYIADVGNNVIRVVSAGPTAPLLNSNPSNPTNQTTAVFAFVSTDANVTSFVCTLDGSSNACASPVTYSGLSDGSHTFSLVGKASDGTPSSPVSYTWVVDTVPPPMPSIDSHPSNPSATANASFSFSDAEAGVSFTCTLDLSANFCGGVTSYLGLADGSHTFSVTATDTSGNQSAANVFSWTIQTTTPPSPHIDSAPAALSNQIAPAFSFSDAQAGVVFTCQLDAAQPAPCSSPAVYVGLADGIHTFSVIASDPRSGRSSTPATFAWTKDTTPPTVSCCSGSATVVIPDPAFFYFNSGSSDVVSFLCSLDGAAFASCTSPVTLSITTPGDHTFAVKGIDAAGNVGDASVGGVHVTHCRCQLPGDYSNPVFNDQINATSQNFKVRVTHSGNGSDLADISVVDSGGTVLYTLPTTARGWQFSPDQMHFVFLSSLPYPNSPVEATVLDLSTSPATRILTISNVGGAMEFSPSGTYLMVVGAPLVSGNSSQYSVSVYRVGDVSRGVLVYSTTSFGATAGWGFSHSGLQEAETSFLFAFASGQETVTWNVAYLPTGKQTISQTSTLGNAFWQFNPCGNIIALVSNKPGFSEQVDLFSTETGTHLGGTSFPVQNVTISSTVDNTGIGQEVGKITNPLQTIVIAQDNCGPNTKNGSNVTVSPVCSQTNSSPVTVTFSNVSQDGGTGVNESSTGNAPPGDFQIGNPPVYYDIATSATYSGDITICINYAGITFSGTPRLFHYENGAWVDRTTSVDATTHTVCATVSSLSPFALFSEPAPQAPAFTSADSVTFQLGAAGGFTVLSSGNPTSALSESGALPAGMSFVDNHDGSAVLTGTPTAGGTFNLTLSASNSAGNATQTFALTVNGAANQPPTANAGTNQILEATSPAGALVTLSGSGSDPDNDSLTFTWSEGAATLGAGAQISVTLPIGTHTITLTADDGRGGTGTSTVLITVQDTIAPKVICGSPDAAWHGTDLSITCTASDSGSGLSNLSDASFTLSTSVGIGTETSSAQTSTHTVCDVAGNCLVAGPIGPSKVDKKGPTVTLSAPANGSIYLLNQAVAVNYSCVDGGSGLSSCSGTVASGASLDTSSVGSKSFTVTAIDALGNKTLDTNNYTVTYAPSGICGGDAGHQILQPINADGSSVWKQGRTVPAKFRVCDVKGVSVGTPGVVASFTLAQIISGTATDVDEAVSSTSSDVAFRWDSSAQQWIFNISTANLAAGQTYVYRIQLNDGSSIGFRFGLK